MYCTRPKKIGDDKPHLICYNLYMEKSLQVGILEDHIGTSYGYILILQNRPHINIAWQAEYYEDVTEMMQTTPVDVLILDAKVPTSRQDTTNYPLLHAIPDLLNTYPELAILIISAHNQPALIKNAKIVGSSGYILKSDTATINQLPEIIRNLAAGGICFPKSSSYEQSHQKTIPELTPRQLEVLSLKASAPGMTTKAIALKLEIAPPTVRNLLSDAYERLGVNTMVAALDRARQLGLLLPDELEF